MSLHFKPFTSNLFSHVCDCLFLHALCLCLAISLQVFAFLSGAAFFYFPLLYQVPLGRESLLNEIT